MNSKFFAVIFLIFGIVICYTQAGRLNLRDLDDSSDDSDDTSADSSNDDSGEDAAADFENEKRAIQNFLEDNEEASQFLDQSRRLFVSDQKSHMKEAKKKYEEKCERLLHPRYCPDLATWPAWNQAFAAATGKKK